MTNFNGFGLTGRLIAKHFGNLGNTIAEAIASFDPETATQVDRERLEQTLTQAAQKQAVAQREYKDNHAKTVALQELVDTDSKTAAVLLTRLEAGTMSEAQVNKFSDELEANTKRLATLKDIEAQSKEYLDEVQNIVTILSNKLADFDARAEKAMRELKSAQAQVELQAQHQERQNELAGFKREGGHASGLDALASKAQKLGDQADAMKIVTGIHQAPLDQAAEIDAIRASVRNPSPTESAAERLRRLASTANDKTAA